MLTIDEIAEMYGVDPDSITFRVLSRYVELKCPETFDAKQRDYILYGIVM